VLTWKLKEGSADALVLKDNHSNKTRSANGGTNNNSNTTNDDTSLLHLVTLRMPAQAEPKEDGVHEWRLSQSSITLDVEERTARQLDDVAVSYAGKVKVVGARVDFPCLVRAAAKVAASKLREKHAVIQDLRPLLPSEEQYLRLLESLKNV